MAVRLHHVQMAIPPDTEEAARAFWCTILGFEEVPKPEPMRGRGGLWVRSGAAEIHLGVEAPFAPARKAHPAIVFDELAPMVERLESAGHATRTDVDIDGHRRVHTHDPFGNRLELLSPIDSDPVGGEGGERRPLG